MRSWVLAFWSANSPAPLEPSLRSGIAVSEVQKLLMEELGLGVPVASWHVARDGLAEAVNFLALLTGRSGNLPMT